MRRSAYALGKLGEHAKPAVPALTKYLEDRDDYADQVLDDRDDY